MLSKQDILARMQRRTQTISSDVFVGDLRIRELLRSEYRAIQAQAQPDGEPFNVDRWNAGCFAAIVIDASGEPMFTVDEVLQWPERPEVWDEVVRVANAGLNFSEVGTAALKKPSGDSPATTDATPKTEANSTP